VCGWPWWGILTILILAATAQANQRREAAARRRKETQSPRRWVSLAASIAAYGILTPLAVRLELDGLQKWTVTLHGAEATSLSSFVSHSPYSRGPAALSKLDHGPHKPVLVHTVNSRNPGRCR
jgi:hypothetical protein